MTKITDTQLLEKVKHGDREAFRAIFQKYYHPLFNFTVSRIRDSDIASDIVQETFVRVWKNREFIKPKKAFFNYLASIASNLSKDHFRHLAVRQRHESHIESKLYSSTPHVADRRETAALHEKILEAIHTHLPEKCRNIFILNRFEGLSSKEIADMMNLSVRTVENQLYRGLKILKKKLSGLL